MGLQRSRATALVIRKHGKPGTNRPGREKLGAMWIKILKLGKPIRRESSCAVSGMPRARRRSAVRSAFLNALRSPVVICRESPYQKPLHSPSLRLMEALGAALLLLAAFLGYTPHGATLSLACRYAESDGVMSRGARLTPMTSRTRLRLFVMVT